MNIRIFSFPVFSFQFNVNNTDGVATNRRTPITIISIDKIINTFISSLLFPYCTTTNPEPRSLKTFSFNCLLYLLLLLLVLF